MKTTVLFLTILALTSYISAQKAFDQVRSLLTNFQNDISKEQHDADIRNDKDVAQCTIDIAAAEGLVASRQKDVDDLSKHIDWLNNEKSEADKDRVARVQRIADNKKMLEDFKKQRCDNNLIFVKQLREHMEAIDIMTLLKTDLNEYFSKKKTQKVNPAFIERFAEFSHLLSEEHKQIFLELSQTVQNLPDVNALTQKTNDASAAAQRTVDQVGTGHVDNTQGALQKLEGVAFANAAAYNDTVQKKINDMIDGLVQHLKDSRNELTKTEIKAAEDFAIFQTNTEKENVYLAEKINKLEKTIADLTNQLNVATAQLEKRKNLLSGAQVSLKTTQQICQEKSDYYKKETTRRNGELVVVANASGLFNNILAKLSQRVKDRADQISSGSAAGQALDANVASQATQQTASLNANVASRNNVVFVEKMY